MGSSPFLRTHHATIEADSDGRLVLKFNQKMSVVSVQEPLNEIQEEEGELFRQRAESMDLYNRRGCEEIMC